MKDMEDLDLDGCCGDDSDRGFTNAADADADAEDKWNA
jgi:hypothetical protein